jgi:hypothetical protein
VLGGVVAALAETAQPPATKLRNFGQSSDAPSSLEIDIEFDRNSFQQRRCAAAGAPACPPSQPALVEVE